MEKSKTKDPLILICKCGSYSHQVIFWDDKEENTLYLTVHLITHRNFFKRLWYGLRYAFGYTSNFGDWDEFLFKPEDEKKLKEYLQKQ